MRTGTIGCGLLVAAAMSMGALVFAEGAATRPAAATRKAEPEVVIGEMRVQTLPGFTYFYGSAETTFAGMQKTLEKFMPALMELQDSGKVVFHGGAVFVYKDVKDMTSPFTLEVGFETKEGTKEQGAFKVRKTGEFRCATLLYSGPLSHLKEGYDKLMGEMAKKGLEAKGESREAYLAWEGPDSENNVVQIQIEIAEGKGK